MCLSEPLAENPTESLLDPEERSVSEHLPDLEVHGAFLAAGMRLAQSIARVVERQCGCFDGFLFRIPGYVGKGADTTLGSQVSHMTVPCYAGHGMR